MQYNRRCESSERINKGHVVDKLTSDLSRENSRYRSILFIARLDVPRVESQFIPTKLSRLFLALHTHTHTNSPLVSVTHANIRSINRATFRRLLSTRSARQIGGNFQIRIKITSGFVMDARDRVRRFVARAVNKISE